MEFLPPIPPADATKEQMLEFIRKSIDEMTKQLNEIDAHQKEIEESNNEDLINQFAESKKQLVALLLFYKAYETKYNELK